MLHNLKSWLKTPLCWFGSHDWWYMQTAPDDTRYYECSRCSALQSVHTCWEV